MATSVRLQKLRALMKSNRFVNETLAAYVIPTDDQHQVISINSMCVCMHACMYVCIIIVYICIYIYI